MSTNTKRIAHTMTDRQPHPPFEAWHWLRADRRLNYPPHTLVEIGQTLTATDAPLALCEYGLHWSLRPLDALMCAPGPIVCRVRVSGDVVLGDSMGCSTERTVIVMADATETLRAFARWSALQVIHLWYAPDVVRQYLETGDESLRDASWDAARAAACAAAYDNGVLHAIRAAQNHELERRLLKILEGSHVRYV